MTPLRIVVAPDGVAIAKDAQEALPAPKLLWTVAPVAAALLRPMLPNPKAPSEVETHVLRADATSLVWQMGPWVLHGSDLRGASLDAFFELVQRSRASARPPLHVMYGVGADEGVPVGWIAQVAGAGTEAPLPMVTFPLPRDVQTMWLVGCRLALAARLGEAGLRDALAAVARIRRAHGDFAAAFDPTRERLAEQGVTGDEAVAALILEGWEADGGGAKAIGAFRAALG